jgi:hypothetical protein
MRFGSRMHCSKPWLTHRQLWPPPRVVCREGKRRESRLRPSPRGRAYALHGVAPPATMPACPRRSSSPSVRLEAASVLQASGFRSDVTVFRLNARPRPKTGSSPTFRRNTAERVYTFEAAHNPEVAGSDPAPATAKRPRKRGLSLKAVDTARTASVSASAFGCREIVSAAVADRLHRSKRGTDGA